MKQLLSIISSIIILIGLLWLTGCSQDKEIKVITFETTLGPVVIELFEEEAPITSKNFLEYAESGFFNGTLFHRVIPGFVIQGGVEPKSRCVGAALYKGPGVSFQRHALFFFE